MLTYMCKIPPNLNEWPLESSLSYIHLRDLCMLKFMTMFASCLTMGEALRLRTYPTSYMWAGLGLLCHPRPLILGKHLYPSTMPSSTFQCQIIILFEDHTFIPYNLPKVFLFLAIWVSQGESSPNTFT